MSSVYEQRLAALSGAEQAPLLTAIHRGIEKECLRISAEGRLAQTPHPAALGSALTHAYITTDYSEALLEFITPVTTDVNAALATLEDIHRFTYSQIDGDGFADRAVFFENLRGHIQTIDLCRVGVSNDAAVKKG